MNEYKNIEKDYRKWILFNTLLSDFQNLYELYTAVDSRQSKAGVSFNEEFDEGETKFIVEQEGTTQHSKLMEKPTEKDFWSIWHSYIFQTRKLKSGTKQKSGQKRNRIITHFQNKAHSIATA